MLPTWASTLARPRDPERGHSPYGLTGLIAVCPGRQACERGERGCSERLVCEVWPATTPIRGRSAGLKRLPFPRHSGFPPRHTSVKTLCSDCFRRLGVPAHDEEASSVGQTCWSNPRAPTRELRRTDRRLDKKAERISEEQGRPDATRGGRDLGPSGRLRRKSLFDTHSRTNGRSSRPSVVRWRAHAPGHGGGSDLPKPDLKPDPTSDQG